MPRAKKDALEEDELEEKNNDVDIAQKELLVLQKAAIIAEESRRADKAKQEELQEEKLALLAAEEKVDTERFAQMMVQQHAQAPALTKEQQRQALTQRYATCKKTCKDLSAKIADLDTLCVLFFISFLSPNRLLYQVTAAVQCGKIEGLIVLV